MEDIGATLDLQEEITAAAHPIASVAHPIASVAHPIASVAHPRASVAHPRASVAHPIASVAHPRASVAHPRASIDEQEEITNMKVEICNQSDGIFHKLSKESDLDYHLRTISGTLKKNIIVLDIHNVADLDVEVVVPEVNRLFGESCIIALLSYVGKQTTTYYEAKELIRNFIDKKLVDIGFMVFDRYKEVKGVKDDKGIFINFGGKANVIKNMYECGFHNIIFVDDSDDHINSCIRIFKKPNNIKRTKYLISCEKILPQVDGKQTTISLCLLDENFSKTQEEIQLQLYINKLKSEPKIEDKEQLTQLNIQKDKLTQENIELEKLKNNLLAQKHIAEASKKQELAKNIKDNDQKITTNTNTISDIELKLLVSDALNYNATLLLKESKLKEMIETRNTGLAKMLVQYLKQLVKQLGIEPVKLVESAAVQSGGYRNSAYKYLKYQTKNKYFA